MTLRPPIRRRTLALALCVALVSGCAGTGGSSPPNPGAPNPNRGPSAGDRGNAALEGALMGAIIGGQLGPFGAAAGAGALLIYGAVTGRSPWGGGGGISSGPRGERQREEDLEAQIDQEVDRQATLENEIEQELKRQEDLLASIDHDDSVRDALDKEASPGLSDEEAAEQADVRAAPLAPKDRDLPEYIFDVDTIEVPRGQWGNDHKLTVTRHSLDADRDGKPEEIRYFDSDGQYIRKEEDRDYDGQIDAWSTFRNGLLVTREIDADNDGSPDIFERYGGARMTAREIDRNHDGKRDAFYEYQDDSLRSERHDTNYDGKIDFQASYVDRRRVSSEEDADKDGRFDTWTKYAPDDDEDVIVSIERDKTGDGKRDTFETYAQEDGKTILKKREEDKNADGVVDIVSIYEDGKLVRREISDPALMPL